MGPLELIHTQGVESLGRYYSTYRAVVLENEDNTHTGKILLHIPMIQSGIRVWASPKSIGGGLGYGFKYLTPPKGEIVWVEFEYGDPARPLWSYHPWALGEMPDELKSPNTIGLVTPKGHSITLNEAAKEDEDILTIQLESGISIKAGLERLSISIPDGSSLEMTKEDISFNGGSNEGLINIKTLTEKLNLLIEAFNNHSHSVDLTVSGTSAGGVVTGSAKGTSDVPKSPATEFNQADYEDTKIKH